MVRFFLMTNRVMINFLILVLGWSCFLPAEKKPYNIAFCVVGTGEYLPYAQALIDSARVHFCRGHKVVFFLFTDGDVQLSEDVHKVSVQKQGWPMDAPKKNHCYYSHKDLFKGMDYIFASDADMIFVSSVGDEILSDLVAVQHPQYIGKRGAYEKNKKSRAFVDKEEGSIYFSRNFYGGKRQEFLKLIEKMVAQIDADLKNGLLAKWKEERHINRYFIDHPPTLILSPSYCYPENWQLQYPKKIVAMDKALR